MFCFLLAFSFIVGWGSAIILLTLLLLSFWLGGGQHPPYSTLPLKFLDWGGGLPSIPHHALPPSLLLCAQWLGGGGHQLLVPKRPSPISLALCWDPPPLPSIPPSLPPSLLLSFLPSLTPPSVPSRPLPHFPWNEREREGGREGWTEEGREEGRPVGGERRPEPHRGARHLGEPGRANARAPLRRRPKTINYHC